MKKSDANFTKAISDIVSESSLEHLKIQSVIDRSWSHGYHRGWVKGYFSGLIVSGSILAVAWVWRSVGRLEGFEKGVKEGAKDAGFWRRLYNFNKSSRFGENCERSSDKKSSDDEDDIDGDTEIHDDPGDVYDRMHEEGKC